jgi:hypothetical protein
MLEETCAEMIVYNEAEPRASREALKKPSGVLRAPEIVAPIWAGPGVSTDR